jgi:hypothetical protein
VAAAQSVRRAHLIWGIRREVITPGCVLSFAVTETKSVMSVLTILSTRRVDMVKREQIKELINEVIAGVDKSSIGPVFSHPDPSDLSNVQLNQVAWSACAIVLTQLSKNMNQE